jgi:hypothetical protein
MTKKTAILEVKKMLGIPTIPLWKVLDFAVRHNIEWKDLKAWR